MKKVIMYLWNIVQGRNAVSQVRKEEQSDKVEVENKPKTVHSKKDLEDSKKDSKRRLK